MPATKKKKKASVSKVVKTTKPKELNQTLLMVFAFAMMMFALVIYMVYAK